MSAMLRPVILFCSIRQGLPRTEVCLGWRKCMYSPPPPPPLTSLISLFSPIRWLDWRLLLDASSTTPKQGKKKLGWTFVGAFSTWLRNDKSIDSSLRHSKFTHKTASNKNLHLHLRPLRNHTRNSKKGKRTRVAVNISVNLFICCFYGTTYLTQKYKY